MSTDEFCDVGTKGLYDHKWEVTEAGEEMRNEELHNLYSSPDTIRMCQTFSTHFGKTGNVYKIT